MSAAITYAAVKVTWDIPTTIHVSKYFNLNVTTQDGQTQVQALEISELGPSETYVAHFRVFNTGNTKIWVNWSVTGFPEGFTYAMYHVVDGAYDPWVESTELLPIEKNGELPTGQIDFSTPQEGLDSVKLVITNLDAYAGDFNFVLSFSGCDTSIG